MNLEVITPKNVGFLQEVIKNVAAERSLSYSDDDLWLATGSYVINTQRPQSDIDLILARNNQEVTQPTREKVPYREIPVSISIINRRILEQDGSQKYGGYFVGKLLNPLHFFGNNNDLRNFAMSMGGKFIGDYSGYIGSESRGRSAFFTGEEITAHSLIAYLSMNPEYDSYLLSYFLANHFDLIWQFLVSLISESLLLSQKVTKNGRQYKYSGGYKNYMQFNKARLQSVAKRSGFGVYAHNSDYSWTENYFNDAESKIDRIDPTHKYYEEMIRFFKLTSGLENIFI